VREATRVEDAPIVVEGPLAGSERGTERGPPSGRVHQALGPERGDQHANRRDQPDDDHDENRDANEPAALLDADRRLLLRRFPRRLEALNDFGGSRRRGEAHRIFSCSRNCLTFHTSTGTTAANKTTAIAAPRPSLFEMNNHRIIRSAMTSVF